MTRLIAALAALTSLLPLAATAQYTTYADRAAFTSANPDLLTEDFNDLTGFGTPGPKFFSGTVDSYTSKFDAYSGDEIVAPGQIEWGARFQPVYEPWYQPAPTATRFAYGGDERNNTGFLNPAGWHNESPSPALGINWTTTSYWHITFDRPVNAFALDLFLLASNTVPSPRDVRIELDIVAWRPFGYSVDVPEGGSFFGVSTGTDRIAGVTIHNPWFFEVIDNVSYGTPGAPIPEPATWALMVAGIAALGVISRRRPAGA